MTLEEEDETRESDSGDEGILLQPSTSDADPMPPEEEPVEREPVEDEPVEEERG